MRALAILDTSVLVLLLTKKLNDSEKELETDRRREAVKACLHEMQPKFRFGIPTVVVAELTHGKAAQREVERLVDSLGRFTTLAFNYTAGCVAADMWRDALSRKPIKNRQVIKFDTLICATAVAWGATRIVTENPGDFEKHIQAVKATVEVIMPSVPPAKGQLKIFHIKPPKKK